RHPHRWLVHISKRARVGQQRSERGGEIGRAVFRRNAAPRKNPRNDLRQSLALRNGKRKAVIGKAAHPCPARGRTLHAKKGAAGGGRPRTCFYRQRIAHDAKSTLHQGERRPEDKPYLNLSGEAWNDLRWRTVPVAERMTSVCVVTPPRS